MTLPNRTSDVAVVAGRVDKRVRRWLRRRRLLDVRAAEERSNGTPVLSPMEACLQASLFAGEFIRVSSIRPGQEEPDANEARFRVQSKSPWSAEVGGFNVHAGVTIRAGDRVGLEHLLRYAARAPLALSRLSRRADGGVAYRLRKPRHAQGDDAVELLLKIGALVPPPKRSLLRLSAGANREERSVDDLCAQVAAALKTRDASWAERHMAVVAAAMRGRYRSMVRAMVNANVEPVIIEDLVKFGEDRGLKRGRRKEARALLRRVLAGRKLALTAEQDKRIATCMDIARLHRWLDQALFAATADEALR